MLLPARKCPVCGAANHTCGGPSQVVAVDERMVRAAMSGKLVQVTIRPGVSVQMYEEEARQRGLLPPAPEPPKARPTAPNKKRPGAPNKARP